MKTAPFEETCSVLHDLTLCVMSNVLFMLSVCLSQAEITVLSPRTASTNLIKKTVFQPLLQLLSWFPQ